MTSNESPQDRIRALMDEDPLTTAATDDQDGDEDSLDRALTEVGLHALSAEAQNIVLELTGSVAGLELSTRERLVKAAGRGLQSRRDSLTPLPRLLFLARQSTTESIESVATFVCVDADVLLNAERGSVGLETLGAEAVATWVTHFRLPIDQAKDALAKALWLENSGDRAAASAAGIEAVVTSDFFVSVIGRLQSGTDA